MFLKKFFYIRGDKNNTWKLKLYFESIINIPDENISGEATVTGAPEIGTIQ